MLTNTKVKNLKPQKQLYRIADTSGLCLEIKPTGKKFWRYRYRFNYKPNMLSIGEYPLISLAQARTERDKYKTLLLNGANPSIQKIKQQQIINQQQDNTFATMFFKWYEQNKPHWKPNYQNDVKKRTQRHLLPYIGNRSISSLSSQDMLGLLKTIEQAGTIDTLYKVKGVASRVFRYCVGLGVLEHDPTRDLPSEVFKKPKVKHLSHITDPKAIGGLLRMLDGYKGSYQVETALKIAPYLFLRPSELAGLQWAEVDFNDKLIRIKAGRMKMGTTHLVPLAPRVISLLEPLTHIKSTSPFVFPSTATSKRHITPESLRAGLRRLGLSNEEMTTHGFRHLASTRLYEMGFKSDVIERQLAHQERNKVKAAYNHAEYLSERQEMMERWADYLDGLRNND